MRVYETAGRETQAVLMIPMARRVWSCDLREKAEEEIIAPGGGLRFAINAFEIKTFRIERAA